MKKRKNQLINFLKTGLLLFGITLLFFGCKDNDQILELETTQTTITPTIKHTNFSELEKDAEFTNLIEKLNLNQMTDVYQLKNGTSAKNSSNDFTIITNSIKEVQTPTSHSYNILIERNTPTENVIENLVLQNNNGVEKSLIFKYTLKDSNVSARGTTGNNDIDVEVDEISVSDYNGTGNGGASSSSLTCHYETVYVETTCYGPGSSGNHYSECNCGRTIFTCNPPSTWSTLVEVCENNNNGVITGTWNYNTDNSNTSNTNNTDDTVDTSQSLAVLTPAINDHLKHLKKIINTPFSSSPTIEEYYGKTNTITSYLALKNPVLFNDLDIIIREIDLYALNLEETKAIYDKAFEIYGVSRNYDLNTIYSIDQLSVFDQQIVINNTFFSWFLPNLSDLGINLPSSVEEWKALFEIMKPILFEIGLEFVPLGGVYNSAVETLNGINSGDLTAVTIGLVGIIIEFTPFDQIKNFYKLIKHSKKGFKIFKLTRRFTSVIKNALDSGLKIVLDNDIVKFLDDAGTEIARIANNVMTFKYNGFGGNIVTNPNKTTTVVGKWRNGTEEIINSGLSRSGKNKGGINALDVDTNNMSSQDIWNNVNKPWLDEAVSRGDIIRAVSDPNLASNLSNPRNYNGLSFFGMEHNFLTKSISQGGAGYTYDTVNKLYIP
jgi:hypothetical protein